MAAWASLWSAAVLSLAGGGPGPAPDLPPGFWALNYREGVRTARIERRVLLVDFFTTGCEPCKRLDRQTWADPKVTKWISENVVAIKIDAEREKDLAERYQITTYPTLVFIDRQEEELDRIIGFVDGDGFLFQAPTILQGEGRGAVTRRHAKESPEDFDAQLDLARVLAEENRPDPAIEQYLRAWEVMRKDPSLLEFRIPTIAREMHYHGARLRAIDETLTGIRDRAVQTLSEPGELAPQALEIAAREVVDINRTIGQSDQSVDVWRASRGRGDLPPRVLELLFDDSVVAVLYRDKSFREIVEGAGEPLLLVQRDIGDYERVRVAQEREGSNVGLGQRRLAVVLRAARYYAALLAVGDAKRADELAVFLLAFEGTPRTWQELISAALRADADEAADGLLERAGAQLGEGPELERLKRVAERRSRR